MTDDLSQREALRAQLDREEGDGGPYRRRLGVNEHRFLDVEVEYDVLVWRFGQLRAAGYDEPQASELAVCGDIDHHLARRLLVGGCSPELAVRILC